MEGVLAFVLDPTTWTALVVLIAMEIVLGVDNLIFVSILSNKLPMEYRVKARRIGISLALILRLALLSTVAYLARLTEPFLTVMEHGFSLRDLILVAGGLFLVWKATKEIHHNVDPSPGPSFMDGGKVVASFGAAIVQIILLDIVFSLDSIITAIGLTNNLPVMIIAVVVAVMFMLLVTNTVSDFINRNPTIVMLALGFLLMIGTSLIAEGFGAHVPKGYIYSAMAFSALVESLNMMARRRTRAQENSEEAS